MIYRMAHSKFILQYLSCFGLIVLLEWRMDIDSCSMKKNSI